MTIYSVFRKYLNVQNSNFIIYLGTDLLSKIIPFAFVPLFTKYLTPTQYGNISLFNISLEIMVIIIVMGGNAYYKVEFINHQSPKVLLFNLIVNVTYIFIFVLLLSFLFHFFNFNQYLLILLPVIAITAYFQSLLYIFISYYQTAENAMVVGGVNLFFSIVNSFLMVFLLMKMNFHEGARYWSVSISSIISVMIAFVFFHRHWDGVKDYRINKPFFRFGVGMLPHALSWWARSGIDRLLINWFLSVSVMGIYSLAMQITSVMPIFCNALNQALLPSIVRYLSKKNCRAVESILLKASLFLIAICFFSAAIVPFLFKYFIDSKYQGALEYLPYMLILFSFQGILIIYSNVVYYYKQVKFLSVVTFPTSILHILFVILLMNHGFGIMSVIISTGVTFFISMCFVYYKAKKLMQLQTK